MGNFRIVVDAVGGHGCQRNQNIESPIGFCGQQSCPDCIAKEFVEKMVKTQSDVKAKILHWPDTLGNVTEHTVVDEFIINHAQVKSYKNSDGTEGHYVSPLYLERKRSKKM